MNVKLLPDDMQEGLLERHSEAYYADISFEDALREICAWEFGDPSWASEFLRWQRELKKAGAESEW